MKDATQAGSRKGVNVKKRRNVDNQESSFVSNIDVSSNRMERRLRITALASEIVKLCEEDHDLSPTAKDLAKDFHFRIHFALNEQDVTGHPPLPDQPPVRWLERKNRKESPPDFILRVYDRWAGKKLSMPAIRKLDYSLYNALCRYKSEGGAMPAEFDRLVPARTRVLDTELAEAGLIGGGEPMPEIKAALRLYHSAVRRRPKAPK